MTRTMGPPTAVGMGEPWRPVNRAHREAVEIVCARVGHPAPLRPEPEPVSIRLGGLTWGDEGEPAGYAESSGATRMVVWSCIPGCLVLAWLGFFVALPIVGEWIHRVFR
jgi:hypothetical protein